MHTKPLHFIHVEHHRSMLTNVWTAVSFSFLEKLIFSTGIIGFMAALSHIMPISVYGVGAYYIFYFFTNTLGHANIEMRKPGYYDSWMGKLFNTSSYHALHHSRYVKNYGLITPWCDKLFGTMWEDVAEVQSRAARGEPLSRLKEKLA
jgi:sterol desaturase/sphingolipid hydroxylase (fatty acid hydroxylase superfamily)